MNRNWNECARPDTIAGAVVKWHGVELHMVPDIYVYEDVLRKMLELARGGNPVAGVVTGRTGSDELGRYLDVDGFDAVTPLEENSYLRKTLAEAIDEGPMGALGWFVINPRPIQMTHAQEQQAHDAYFQHRGVFVRIDPRGDAFAFFVPDDGGVLIPARFGAVTIGEGEPSPAAPGAV